MSRLAARRGRGEEGVTVLLVALLLIAFMIFAALAIDIGNASQKRRQAQSAADLTALSAVQDFGDTNVSWPTVVAHVKTYAQQNFGVVPSDWTGCSDSDAAAYWTGKGIGTPFYPDLLTNSNRCISADYELLTSRQRLRVHLPGKEVSTFFGRAAGILKFTINATAVAQWSPGGKCVMCVLSASDQKALQTTGSGGITVQNGNIVVNSSATNAISVSNGASSIVSPKTSVVGTINGTSTQVPNSARPGDAPVTDPLAGVPAPPPAPNPLLGTIDSEVGGSTSISGTPPKLNYGGNSTAKSITLNPGVWDQIDASNCSTVNLNAGIYIITGEMKFTHSPCSGGGPNIQGTNVLLYFACPSNTAPYYQTSGCSPEAKGGAFTVNGGATLSVSPRSSGPYQGITIFYDRTNNADLIFTGASGDVFSGAIYAPDSQLTMTGGGSSGTTITIQSAIIAKTISMTGNANININFDPSLAPPGLGTGGVSLLT